MVRRRCPSKACTGSAPGLKAAALLDLGKLSLDFVAMEFTTALTAAWKEPGPHLIDAVIPPLI